MSRGRTEIMPMRRRYGALMTIPLLVASASPALTQDSAVQEARNPLAPFERLIGGEWHLGDGYQ
jgi:hypothetical protein